MSPAKVGKHPKRFDELRKQIDADPARRARVERHKATMLGELRRALDLTQTTLAERLDVTQENVSQIERGEADVRLSTLDRYVTALGGTLEIVATFPDRTVGLSVGREGAMRRRLARTGAAAGGSRPARQATDPKRSTGTRQETTATADRATARVTAAAERGRSEAVRATPRRSQRASKGKRAKGGARAASRS